MQKRFGGGAKEWLLIFLSAALLMAALLLPVRLALAGDLSNEEEQLQKAYQSGQIIRIHVIANSNSPADQALKYKVRDTLIAQFGEILRMADTPGCEAAYRLLKDNTKAMCKAAADCAEANGFSGSVQAETGILHLPAKTYGNITLPEGEYRALRIIIGEGKGENWWCVLYPQLCLALSENADSAQTVWTCGRIFSQWLLMGN